MKKIMFLLTTLLLLGANHSFAQDSSTKKEKFAWQKAYMDEAGISADIQVKIEVIKTESENQLKSVRKDASLSEDQKKEKQKEIYKKRSDDIFALLTKEQKEKVKEIKERIKKEEESK